jgi:hypothetical protein
MEKPAGWARRLTTGRYEMTNHLFVLLLLIVILGVTVKIDIDRR